MYKKNTAQSLICTGYISFNYNANCHLRAGNLFVNPSIFQLHPVSTMLQPRTFNDELATPDGRVHRADEAALGGQAAKVLGQVVGEEVVARLGGGAGAAAEIKHLEGVVERLELQDEIALFLCSKGRVIY